MTTFVFIGSFVVLLLIAASLKATFLNIGLRWARVPGVTWRRVIATTVLIMLMQAVAEVSSRWTTPRNQAEAAGYALGAVALMVVLAWASISTIFKTSALRSLQAWLPTLIPDVALIVFVFLVWRPFVFEAYQIPTNSMAPTLLGRHWRGACPECGRDCFTSQVKDSPFRPSELSICEQLHVRQLGKVQDRRFSGDRIMVARFLKPRRWDLAVFDFPGNPQQTYVMRLVGLPGERIEIKDGAAWADGQRLTPPEDLQGIEYLNEEYGRGLWGSPAQPAQLGEGEYFVLGDFSARSNDSRYWQQGAEGHPPFAVPQSHLRGVVTHIYWPPTRWRIIR